jgi:hypothetical protein
MSTATLTNAPSLDRRSRSWIMWAVLVVLLAAALAAGAFAIGRATKPTVRVPVTTVHAVSPATHSLTAGSCTIAHGFC